MTEQQKRKLRIKIAHDIKSTSTVGMTRLELRSMSRRELLSLTRALVNVRDDRPIEFSVPYVTPKVMRCAKKIANLPQQKREKVIAKINMVALQSI